MATHSRILAWRIPWTEEPGGYTLWGHKESDTTQSAWVEIFVLSLICCVTLVKLLDISETQFLHPCDGD